MTGPGDDGRAADPDDDLSPADRRVAARIADLPLVEPAPGWEERVAARLRLERDRLLGYSDRGSAEAASGLVSTQPGAYELDDGSWAAAYDSTIGGGGGRHHWASLPDGRLVEVERGEGSLRWRIVER